MVFKLTRISKTAQGSLLESSLRIREDSDSCSDHISGKCIITLFVSIIF
jgi:hypothetical protein